ncbi:hypothetical protein ACFLWZ_02635 [Chloroflexota bacterium]
MTKKSNYVLNQKLIIVVKKEVNNLRRVIEALGDTYPDLSRRKLLLIDDEADHASVGFSIKRQTNSVELPRIASQINELRNKVADSGFLQVTATPYSLYLQPDDINVNPNSLVFKPVKPAFTENLPTYNGYIGGSFYFEESKGKNSLASFSYEPIPDAELSVLKSEDRRVFKLEDVMSSRKINALRKAIVTFIVGACIRRLQERKRGRRESGYKYSFVVHTETQKDAHAWQERVVIALKNALIECSYYDAPDTTHIEGEIAKTHATNVPMLMLFRQGGKKTNGLNGLPFWWPVMYAPRNTRTTVYTREALNI